MAAVTTAIIGAAVGVTGLGLSIANSAQQNKLATQARDKAQADSDAQISSANTKAIQDQAVDNRNMALSNERRRVAAPSVSSPAPNSSPATSLLGSSAPAAPSPATVTRGSGTLLGA
jgi:hypothetical protein